MIRIGYQGEIGSNSEEAAKRFIAKYDLKEVELIPLINSDIVIEHLKNKNIDYAVVATKNSTAGIVKETFDAIKDQYLQLVATEILPIHHCLYKRKDIPLNKISTIASHTQALKQTAINRKTLYPNLEEKEVRDTALAAQDLHNGKLSKNYAVLCTKRAGELNDLELIQENLEDSDSNRTEFRVFKLPQLNYDNTNKPTLLEWIRFQFASENGMSIIAKSIMILGTIIAIFIAQTFKLDPINTGITVGSYTTIIILFFTSNSFKNKCKYKSIEGYWKYYSLSKTFNETDETEQKLTIPRIVKIYEEDGQLKFSGFICDRENINFFESKDEILISSTDKCKCALVYFYDVPNEGYQRTPVSGIVHLNWKSKYPSAKINKMQGEYFGNLSGDKGYLTYLRISDKEYNAHRNNTFL